MIKGIFAENFKVIGDEEYFELRPITIFTGPNNSGKSSILSILEILTFLLKENETLDNLINSTKGKLITEKFGGFENLINKISGKDNFLIGLRIYQEELKRNLDIKYRFNKLGLVDYEIKDADKNIWLFKLQNNQVQLNFLQLDCLMVENFKINSNNLVADGILKDILKKDFGIDYKFLKNKIYDIYDKFVAGLGYIRFSTKLEKHEIKNLIIHIDCKEFGINQKYWETIQDELLNRYNLTDILEPATFLFSQNNPIIGYIRNIKIDENKKDLLINYINSQLSFKINLFIKNNYLNSVFDFLNDYKTNILIPQLEKSFFELISTKLKFNEIETIFELDDLLELFESNDILTVNLFKIHFNDFKGIKNIFNLNNHSKLGFENFALLENNSYYNNIYFNFDSLINSTDKKVINKFKKLKNKLKIKSTDFNEIQFALNQYILKVFSKIMFTMKPPFEFIIDNEEKNTIDNDIIGGKIKDAYSEISEIDRSKFNSNIKFSNLSFFDLGSLFNIGCFIHEFILDPEKNAHTILLEIFEGNYNFEIDFYDFLNYSPRKTLSDDDKYNLINLLSIFCHVFHSEYINSTNIIQDKKLWDILILGYSFDDSFNNYKLSKLSDLNTPLFCEMQNLISKYFLNFDWVTKDLSNINFNNTSRSNFSRTNILSSQDDLSIIINKLTDENLIAQIQKQLQYFVNFLELCDDIAIEIHPETNSYRVYIINNGIKTLMQDNGNGFINLLTPLIYMTLKQNGSTFVLKEPEIGLHPSMQSKLADIFFNYLFSFELGQFENFELVYEDYDPNYFNRLIIETHSEYLIRKLQYLVKIKSLNHKNINLYYFNADKYVKEGAKKVLRIEINENGSLSQNFGPGFFDVSDNIVLDMYLSNPNLSN
jgi:predicted ATPase